MTITLTKREADQLWNYVQSIREELAAIDQWSYEEVKFIPRNKSVDSALNKLVS